MDTFKNVNFKHPANIQQEGLIQDITAYKIQPIKRYFYQFWCLITCGILSLLCRWFIQVWIKFNCIQCEASEAQYFYVKGQDGSQNMIKSKKLRLGNFDYVLLEFRLYRYFFDDDLKLFTPIETEFREITNAQILQYDEYDQQKYQQRREKYGENDTEIPDKGVFKTLMDEVLSPFYIFQLYSVILWYQNGTQYYATVILVSSVASIIFTLIESRSNFKRLQDLSKFTIPVNVLRKENKKMDQLNIHDLTKEDSIHLVPGDIIEIQDKMIFPCDMILLNGQCIVNESILTGESIPVMKSAIQESKLYYNPNDEGKQCTLYAGTQCMKTKIANKNQTPLLALVTETGFNTQKGQLIRSIMFPQENSLKFYQDAMTYVLGMVLMALFGFLYTLPSKIEASQRGELTTFDIIADGLDLITIAVPPALTTSLQVGISIALSRLKEKKIFCISPPRVNSLGKVTVMCFDKTGTLTEEGLDLKGIRPVIFSQLHNKLKFTNKYETCEQLLSENNITFDDFSRRNFFKNKDDFVNGRTFVEIMATCHGLAWVDNELIGDPLEIKLFQSTGWELQEEISEPGILARINPGDIALVKRFDFSSKLQRMSVIVKDSTDPNSFRVHVKGSPEKLRELCDPKSLPKSFHKILNFYSQNGYRVLAVGSKFLGAIDVKNIQRDSAETNLTFLGFLVMENKLKDITKDTIHELNQANIRNIMVTGDNVLTAISVARQCGIIHQNQRVYLGDLSEKKLENGKYKIIWKDFDESTHQLNPENLLPQNAIEDVFDEESERELQEELRSSQKIQYTQKNEFSQSSLIIKNLQNEELVLPWKADTEDYVLALSGGAFTHLLKQNNSELLKAVLDRAQVYARMRPEEKALLVKQLQMTERKPLVGFCGDGANDCAALKGADVGISLSQAEASIAAPFTSQIQDISCIPIVLKEGRAALTTSFNCFKFMTLYSVIQFTQVTVLYDSESNLTDQQFFFDDLFQVLPLSMTLGFTEASSQLSQTIPSGSLISFGVLASVIGQSLITALSLIGIYQWLKQQEWFIPTQVMHANNPHHSAYKHCFENTTIFLFGNFQYVAVSLAFAVGKPFRKPFYTNFSLLISTLACLLMDLIFVLYRFKWLDSSLGMIMNFKKGGKIYSMTQEWLQIILIGSLVNAVITILWEKIIQHLVKLKNK